MARKNGVNRELYPIEGGVCAPEGFQANAVCAGFTSNTNKLDLALIVSDKRCPSACVYSTSAVVGAPITVSQRHQKFGQAVAVIINSGVANVFQTDGEQLCEKVCQSVANLVKCDRADVLIASTGKIGKKLNVHTFEKSLKPLADGLEASDEKSMLAAQAIMTTDKHAKQLSYSFQLGDFTCKIGCIFKGNQRVSPQMATTLGVITTDVNISSEMLQRAFLTVAKDTFNLLDVDGTASPNDMFCILANGKAGNCKIEMMDTEYKKFCYILHEFAVKICKMIAREGGRIKLLVCRVKGAKSKQSSRAIAKKVVSSPDFKNAILENRMDRETLCCAITDAGVFDDFSEITISVKSAKGQVVFMEESQALLFSEMIMEEILDADEVEITIDLTKGNFASTAFCGV